MRWIVPLIVALAVQIAWAGGHGGSHSTGGTVHVNGYYRKDGTYVHPYDRAAPGTASYSSSVYEPTTSTSSASVPTTTTYVPPIPDNATVRVHEYDRQDGTHVKEYVRSAPGYADTVVGLTTTSPSRENPATSIVATALATRAVATQTTPTHQSAVSHTSRYSSVSGVQRDAHERIKRSEAAKHDFMRMTGYPNGRPGYVVDHIIPLKRGGCDCPSNMQWQTIQEAKAKDKWE
jgi:hypothetical protein